MKSEAADYLGKANHCLAGARRIATAEVPDVAAREAYLAVFHAAEAYIFEQTGKAVKSIAGSGANSIDSHNTSRASAASFSLFSLKATNSKPLPITA
jgi:hypothetical protein